MTTDAAIHVQGLEKSYKELRVLRGVDFDVARGSIFALLGSNGAGKTTVVNILSTLLKADAGTASVNGFDVATQAAEARESISLTGQFAAVDEILSGRENLVLVARLRHLENPGMIADALLARFGLTDAATPVVLGGGVLTAGHEPLLAAVGSGLAKRVPRAHCVVADVAPVVGAALLGLDTLGAPVRAAEAIHLAATKFTVG